jgi:hypothetical protein
LLCHIAYAILLSFSCQEILMVGVGKRVLRIDTNKVGKGEVYSSEAPLQCPVDKLIDGIRFIGKHDGEVTALSMCQWMTTRLVSSSMDGTVCISPYLWMHSILIVLCAAIIFNFFCQASYLNSTHEFFCILL